MLKYLLDTHTAIWLFTDSKKLSDAARNILANREYHLAVSIAITDCEINYWLYNRLL